MRRIFVFLLAATLAACGDVGTSERLSPSETLDGIDVPTIGTVGDFPDPAHRHVVNVTADGRIVVEGRALTYDAFAAELTRIAGLSRDEPGGVLGVESVSAESVVLRVDRSLPWGATSELVDAGRKAGICRVALAVRHEGDGQEGALWLSRTPRSQVVMLPHTSGWLPEVRLEARRGDMTPNAAFRFVSQAKKEEWDRGKRWWLDADVEVSTGTVLGFMDAMLRAGAAFAGTPSALTNEDMSSSYDELVASASAPAGAIEVRCYGTVLHALASDPPMPTVLRRRGPVGIVE